MDKGLNKQAVKLNEDISCSHVQAISAHMRINNWQFVDKYYRMEAYANN